MDKDLAAYRALKKQEQQPSKNVSKELISTELVNLGDLSGSSRSSSSSSSKERHHGQDQRSLSNSRSVLNKYDIYLYWTSVALKFVLWCSLMVLAVKLEFGSVFFILTLFYLIAINLRKEPKRKGELSAYSVFNPNFEQLDGTLTAEQFERELVYGAVSMRP